MDNGDSLDVALAISRRMLEAARNMEWDALPALDEERNRLLRPLFEGPIDPQQAQRLAAVLKQMLGINDQLVTLGRQELDRYAAALKDLGTGRRAVAAYSAD